MVGSSRLRQLLLDPQLREAALSILASPNATDCNKRAARLALKLTKFQVN
jgi:hypothetical protein